MEVGYVGLGSMGGAIARRMLLNKQKLRVYDLSPDRVSDIAKHGGQGAQSLSALAEQSDIVCLCLPTSENVRTAIFGENGLAKGLKRGALVADMTTGDPLQTKAMAAELAKRGIDMIDAPVSGGPDGAAAGTLAIMVGASEALYAKIKPVFEKVGPNVFRMGDVGAGQTMKLVNNMLLAGCKLLTYEVMTLAAKNGLDPKLACDVLQRSSGRNFTTEKTLPGLLDGQFRGTFTLGLMAKDVNLCISEAEKLGVPMWIGNSVKQMWNYGQAQAGPQQDCTELIKHMEKWSNVQVGQTPAKKK